jgi:hypothetical protein
MRIKVCACRPQIRVIRGKTKLTSLVNKVYMRGVITLVVCALTVIGILYKNPRKAPENELVETGPVVEIIAVKNGYGYQIIHGTNVMVRQDFIPVIPGRKPFASAREAEKAATLVKNKLVNGQNPAISIAELEALQIIY